MRTSKLFAALALATVIASGALAQPSDPNAVWIGLRHIDEGLVTNAPTNFLTPGTADTVDLTGYTGIQHVLVTVYARATPDSTLGRLGLINTFINLGGTPGVDVEEGFVNNRWDGGTTRSDARKNAYSDAFGYRDIDSAGNNLKNNSARPYEGGDNIKGAAGKSLFPGGLTDPIDPNEGYLYSFVIRIDTASAPMMIPIDFARVGATEGVPLRTNFGYEFSNNFAPAAYGGVIFVPEPASMIALGSGLVGLLALRRRRSN